MSKAVHTHLGTCQACGARQAVTMLRGLKMIAKHGYRVAGFGFFAGTCPGSDKRPAEFDITYTHSVIARMGKIAIECDRLAGLWSDGSLMVHMHTVRSGKYDRRGFEVYHDVMMFGCAEHTLAAQRRNNEEGEKSQARQCRSHAESLLKHVVPRYGRELYAVADEVKRVKPTEARVNIKAGTIEGAFHTKAAQKYALEGISREYDKQRRLVMDAVLAIAYEARTEAQNDLYQSMPFDLCHFRALKHGDKIVTVFPELASVNFEICRLVDLRNAVKAMPVIKGGQA